MSVKKLTDYICADISPEKVEELKKFLQFASEQGLVLGYDETMTMRNVMTLCDTWKRQWVRASPINVPRGNIGTRTRLAQEKSSVVAEDKQRKEIEGCVEKWVATGLVDEPEARKDCECLTSQQVRLRGKRLRK